MNEVVGPQISLEDASLWVGEPGHRIWNLVVRGKIKGITLGPRIRRVDERSLGAYYGKPVPGPRELELNPPPPPAKPAPARPRRKTDHWLYWFYDDSGDLLYIGITNSGVKRMEQHGADKVWWPEVRNITVDHFSTREEAEAAEIAAIKQHLPKHNGMHNPRKREAVA